MNIQWMHPKCIICLKSNQLNREHVIPESLGGILTSGFLCIDCNSGFGAGFEAKARLSPELRKTASDLGESLSELKEKLEIGARYKSSFGEQLSEQKLRKDGGLGATQLGDGSLIIPESDAEKKIASMMRKRGVASDDIATAVAKWDAVPPGKRIEIGAGIEVLKWQEHPATPTYTEPPLSPLVPLKIAYEFAALLVGGSIYDSAFEHLRGVLIEQDGNIAASLVTYRWADKPDAFHGIAFEGNRETAQFQVRLFGLLAYTVRFPKIGITHPSIVYTHRLDSGEDWARLPDQGGPK
jgi:hypothetical protein